MRVEQIRAIHGPNVISHQPVLVMRLDLDDLAGKESHEIPGFIDRLLEALPGIREHVCGLGYAGGFVERLRGGTYFGHIVEHVCLELTDRAGISVNRGKTTRATSDAVYDIAVEYRSEAGMRRLLPIAVEYVQSLVNGEPYPIDERIAEVHEIVRQGELGPSTKAIVDAAEERGIPWTRLNDDSLIQLGYGVHRRFVQAALSSETSAIAVDAASDKELTKALLTRAAVPVPFGVVVDSADAAVQALEEAHGPVVVKPLDGNQGKGVSLGIETPQQAREAFEIAARYSPRVIVEAMLHGRDYRLLVLNGRLAAASERIPARVSGDGAHSVRELIELENAKPERGDGHSKALSTIRIDPVMICSLEKQNLDLDAVPAANRIVNLRGNANLSTGGSAIDVTDRVHESMRLIAERAARAIGLDICGVDLVVPDIAEPFTTGGVVEVNAAPGLRMHEFPSEGTPRRVAAEIVRMLYPEGNGRIPIVAVTGTNGKTTTARLVAHVFATSDKRVGMTTTDGIWIAGSKVASGDMTGPRSAAAVLSDPSVEVAVLETARGGIVRNGLGYDWSDVGIMTNIHPDHIGQDGIESVEDILRIKSLVAERVKEGGTLVLNADDPMLIGVPEQRKVSRVPKQVVWFSLDPRNTHVRQALDTGGTGYVVQDGAVLELSNGHSLRIVELANVPLTFGGAARFQVANVLAAIAACRAMGAGVAQIRRAMYSFDAGEHNPSRVNLFTVNGGHFLFDYGHNTRAIEEIVRLAEAWPAEVRTCVVGLPGDRSDEILEQAARTVGRGFSRILVREEKDLRGRRPGELPALIAAAVRAENPRADIEFVPDEREAVARALERIAPGDLVVAFCDDCSGVRSVIEARGGTPSVSIEPRILQRALIA